MLHFADCVVTIHGSCVPFACRVYKPLQDLGSISFSRTAPGATGGSSSVVSIAVPVVLVALLVAVAVSVAVVVYIVYKRSTKKEYHMMNDKDKASQYIALEKTNS